jgi:hypothetical protein
VTSIGAAKIYLSYRDRLFTEFKPDWTYPIDFCINHIENNVAIIVANIPILRGLVTRWVFNFKTKATPMERDFRNERQWSTSNSSTFTHVARHNRILQKIMPCIDDDFSSSLAGSKDFRDPTLPPRVVPSNFRSKNRSFKSRSRKQSRRNSLERYEEGNSLDTYRDTFEEADCCEKGDVLDRVRSTGSLGSAPTLVESHKEIEWRLSEASSMWHSRRMSSPPMSPIAPMMPCILREVEDEDEILRYP